MADSLLKRLWTLFCVFFKIAAVTPGGAYVMLPIIRQEFVDKRRWFTDNEMLEIIALSQSLPGLISGNIYVLVGYRIAKIPGAAAGLIGGVLPSFIAIIALAAAVSSLRRYDAVAGAFLGIRAAFTAAVFAVAFSLTKKLLSGTASPRQRKLSAALIISSFAAITFLGVSTISIVIFGGIFGLMFMHSQPEEKSK